jgi:hypothetical protein
VKSGEMLVSKASLHLLFSASADANNVRIINSDSTYNSPEKESKLSGF